MSLEKAGSEAGLFSVFPAQGTRSSHQHDIPFWYSSPSHISAVEGQHGIESRDRISARNREGGDRRGAHDGLWQAQVLGPGGGRRDARGTEPAEDARHD